MKVGTKFTAGGGESFGYGTKRADFARYGNRSGRILRESRQRSSQSLISDSSDSEFYHQRQRKEAISAEIKACLDLYFAGRGKEEVQLRFRISFGV